MTSRLLILAWCSLAAFQAFVVPNLREYAPFERTLLFVLGDMAAVIGVSVLAILDRLEGRK